MLLEEATLRRNTNEQHKETNATTCARGVPRTLSSATTHAASTRTLIGKQKGQTGSPGPLPFDCCRCCSFLTIPSFASNPHHGSGAALINDARHAPADHVGRAQRVQPLGEH